MTNCRRAHAARRNILTHTFCCLCTRHPLTQSPLRAQATQQYAFDEDASQMMRAHEFMGTPSTAPCTPSPMLRHIRRRLFGSHYSRHVQPHNVLSTDISIHARIAPTRRHVFLLRQLDVQDDADHLRYACICIGSARSRVRKDSIASARNERCEADARGNARALLEIWTAPTSVCSLVLTASVELDFSLDNTHTHVCVPHTCSHAPCSCQLLEIHYHRCSRCTHRSLLLPNSARVQ